MRAMWLVCCIALAGCAAKQAEIIPPPDDNVQISEYKIGVGDRVRVDVWRNPDLSITVPVRPDGMVSAPLIGDIQASGVTATEMAQRVKEKLSKYIRDPQVSVILLEARSTEYQSRVRVTGAVRNPTSIAYRQGMTVLDIVLEAGGLNEFAQPDNARLYRKIDGETKVYPIKLNDILQQGDLKTNYKLVSGDVITVPERRVF